MVNFRNVVLPVLLLTAPAVMANDLDRLVGPEVQSMNCTDGHATDGQSTKTVWLVFTLLCMSDTCRHADYAPPLAFRSKAACISFATEAHKEGMPYACEPVTWGDASETESKKML